MLGTVLCTGNTAMKKKFLPSCWGPLGEENTVRSKINKGYSMEENTVRNEINKGCSMFDNDMHFGE